MSRLVVALAKLVSTLLIALLMIGSVPTAAFAAPGTLTLSTYDAHWSTNVTVSGSGYTANKTGGATGTGPIVRFDGVEVARCAVGNNGSASGVISAGCSFAVPYVDAGTYQVTITDQTTPTNTESAAFAVKAAAITSLSPSTGTGNITVNVSGQGFKATAPITFDVDEQAASSTCTSTATGTFTNCAITMPYGEAGPARVTARDNDGRSAFLNYTRTLVKGTFTLNPTAAPWGTTVTVTGTGWTASRSNTAGPVVRFDGQQVAVCATGTGGALTSCTFTVPDEALGAGHTVTVTDPVNSFNNASQPFTINGPTVSLSPTGGTGGSTVTVSGTGYRPNAGIQLLFDGELVVPAAPCRTNPNGAFSSCSIVVPFRPQASYPVVARDVADAGAQREGLASYALSLTAGAMSLSPTTGAGGTVVTVNGTSGWTANATTANGPIVEFDGTQVTRCTTNGTGGLTGCTFTVPPVAQGGYTVRVTDGTNPHNRNTATFTVNAPTITLGTTSGGTGTVTTVTGSGFRGGATVEFFFGGTKSRSTCVATEHGTLSGCQVTVPTLTTTGTMPVTASDLPAGEGQRTANSTNSFNATAVVQLSSAEGSPTDLITVTGTGFNASQAVELGWGPAATPIPDTNTCGTTAAGVLNNCYFHIPAGWSGPYTISATVTSGMPESGRRSASAPLDVFRQTSLTVSPVTAVYGDTATLTATLTRSNPTQNVDGRTVAFSLRGSSVGTAVTNSSGVATLTSVNLNKTPVAVAPHAGAITASFAGDSTHRASNGSAALTITPKTITGSFTAQNKVYDATSAATIDGRSLSGVESGDTVSLSGGSATFADKNIGTAKAVSGTGFALSGADAGNYTLGSSSLATTANITAKAATIAFTAGDKIYDGNATATIVTRPVTGVVTGDEVTAVGGTAAFGNKNVGNGKTVSGSGFSLTGADAGNYTFNTTSSTTANITRKALTVTATAENKVYDRTLAATVTLGDNRVAGDELDITHGPATFADAAVGVLKAVSVPGIDVAGTDAGNYTFNDSALAFADITAKGLVVTFTAEAKIYDGTRQATIASYDLEGVRDGDEVSVVDGTVAFDDKNVANGKTVRWSHFVLDGGDAANYSLASDMVTATADITQRQLVVSAASPGKVYDRTTNAVATLADDRVAGDTLELDYATAEYRTATAAAGKPVDVEGITVTGTSAGNYTWNTTAVATATISQAPLSVIVTAENKVYDATTAAAITLSDDSIGADDAAVTHTRANFDSKTTGTAKTVTASGLALTGDDAANYTIPATATGTADITAKPITASFTVASKVYDRTAAATLTGNGLAGVEAGDTVAIDGGTAAFANKNVASPKTATISGYSLTGTDAGNYTVNSSATAPAAITPRALTVSASGSTRVYDGTTNASVTLSDDRIAGDVLSTSYTGASYDTKHAASTKPVSVVGIAIGGDDAANYTANTTASTTGGIVRRDLEVTATGHDKVYDRTTTATVTLHDDRVSGDTLTPISALATFGDRNVGTNKHISVEGISVIGADAANYTVNPTTTTRADITRKALLVSATGVDKVYDQGTVAQVTLSDNRISGDELTANYAAAAFQNKNVHAAKPVSVTGITISGADAGNYSANETASATAAITPKALLVSAAGVDKTYDGSTAAEVVLSNNRISGDAVSANYTAASFNDRNAGAAKPVSVSGITITGTDAGNYTANTTAATTAAINPKNVTGAFTAANKIYDGGIAATVATRTVQGRIGDDALVLTTGAATFADKHVGSGKTVTWNGFALTGTDAGNYNLTNNSATAPAAITPRSLTATAAAENKRYDGTRAATVALGDNRLSGDAVTLGHAPALFDTKDVGTNKDVTVSDIAITGGADAANYALSSTAAVAKAAITAPDALTVTFTARNKVYDGTTAAEVVDYVLGGVKTGDNVTLTGGAVTFPNKTAGTGKTVTWTGFSLSGSDASNYSLGSTTATAPATIAPKPLTVTATGVNREYTGFTAATVTMTSAQLVAGDTVTFAATSTAFDNKNVGSGKTVNVSGITHSGVDAANYTLSNTTTTTTADITRKTLTVTATGVNKVYDGGTAATVTLANDRVSGDVVTTSYNAASFANKSVANVKTVTVSGIAITGGTDAGNYTLGNTGTTTVANITPKALTVSAAGINKVYDRTITATVTLSSDKLSSDTVTLASTGATFNNALVGTGKPVTVTGVSISGLDAGNYALQNTVADTTASITAKPLTITATAANKEYDGNTVANATLSTPDRVSGDTVSLHSTGSAFNTKNVGSAKPVTVSGLSIAGADSTNYALQNLTAPATASITAKQITVNAAAADKVYDRTTGATVTLSAPAKINGDDVSFASAPATFDNKTVGTGKIVSVTGITKSGADAGNYTLSATTASTTAAITPKALTVSAAGIDKIYDGNTTAQVNLTSDRLGDDAVTLTSATPTFNSKTAATGKAVAVTGIEIGGADAVNYALANTTAATTAAVTPKALTVTATGLPKVYDATAAAQVSLATTDTVPGDTVTLHNAGAAYGDKNVGNGKAISVTGISLAGADRDNYALVNGTAATTANVTPAALIAAFTADDKVYDQSAHATILTGDLRNRLGADQVSLTGATASFSDKHAGENKTVTVSGYSLNGADATNYTVNPTATTTATISQKALTPVVHAEHKAYDGTRAATVSLTDDRIDGDVFTLTHNPGMFDTRHIGERKPVTVTGIAINPAGADAANYRLVTDTAGDTADIYRGDGLTVEFSVADKDYDGTTDATGLDYRLIGVTPGDDVTLTGGTYSFDNAAAGIQGVTWSGFELAGDHAANYELATANESTTATIRVKNLTVTATSEDKVYDGTADADVTLATEHLAAGDVLDTDITLTHEDATFADHNVGNDITINVTGIGIEGDKAANYELSNEGRATTTTASITPRNLTVTLSAPDKVYDGTTDAPAAQLGDDRVSGDLLDIDGDEAVFETRNAGVPNSVSITNITVGGADAGNYALVDTTATVAAAITKKALTVAARERTYPQYETFPGFGTPVVTGLLAGDTLTTVSFRVTNSAGQTITPTSSTAPGTYTITPGGATAANYDIEFVSAPLNVMLAAPSVAYKPDGLVALSNTASAYKGSKVYNTTGTNQTVAASVKRGSQRAFFIKVRNDGKATDSLRIKGCGSGDGQSVTYVTGVSGSGTSITTKVVGGSYQFANVTPGAVRTFRAIVKVGAAAKLTTRTCAVTVSSAGRTDGKDTVKFKVTATR